MDNPLSSVTSWLYHLGDVDTSEAARIAASSAGLVVIDYANSSGDAPVPYTPDQLTAMRGSTDKLIVSYLSIGEAEDYRSYWKASWDSSPPSFLSASNPEWPDNFKVKYWDPAWQNIIFNYVDKIIAGGFNGLYLDVVDSFQYWEEVAPKTGIDYRTEMAEFVAAIDEYATAKLAALGDTRDFVILGQNGEELADNPTYLAHIDGLAKEDLQFYYANGNESSFNTVPDTWLSGSIPFLEKAEAAGVEVFIVEYMTKARQTANLSILQAEIDYLHSKNIPLYIAEERDLLTIYVQPSINGPVGGGGTPAPVSMNLVTGTTGADILYGGSGNETIDGGLGNDTMIGKAGDDTYVVDATGDRVYETTTMTSGTNAGGLDTVRSAVGFNLDATQGVRFVENLILTGTANIDATGNALANLLIGNAGNNVIKGGLGNDTMIGGAGDDTYIVQSAGDQVFETTTTSGEVDAGGLDTVQSTVSFNLDAAPGVRYVENLMLKGTAHINGIGNALANRLSGNAGNNLLDGGGGHDTLIGGAGNDTYVVDDAGDRVFETTTMISGTNAGGVDTVRSAVSFNLDATQGVRFVENLILTGAANTDATGNALANILTGNAGNNVIKGGLGNDTMIGGAGDDTYFVNSTGDRVFESTTTASGIDAGGLDTVQSTVTLNLDASSGVRFVENLVLNGTANINGIGNAKANWLMGNAANNVLIGGGGNDTLIGGAGNDTLQGGAGDDILNGGSGKDILNGGTGADRFVFQSGDGAATITDFQNGIDMMNFANVAQDSYNLQIIQSGANTVVTLNDMSITLLSVDHTQITLADIFFI